MNKVLSAELYKLKFNKAFYFCLLVVAAFSFYDIYTTKNATAESVATGIAGTLGVFICFTASAIACEDYEKNTIKNLISSGNSRGHIYMGKLWTTVYAAIIYFIVDAVVSVGSAYVMHGTGDGLKVIPAVENVLAQLLMVLVFALTFFGIASIVRTSKGGTIVGIVFLLGTTAAPTIISKAAHVDVAEFSLGTLTTNIEKLNFTTNMIINFCIYGGIAILLNLIAGAMFKKYKA